MIFREQSKYTGRFGYTQTCALVYKIEKGSPIKISNEAKRPSFEHLKKI